MLKEASHLRERSATLEEENSRLRQTITEQQERIQELEKERSLHRPASQGWGRMERLETVHTW